MLPSKDPKRTHVRMQESGGGRSATVMLTLERHAKSFYHPTSRHIPPPSHATLHPFIIPRHPPHHPSTAKQRATCSHNPTQTTHHNTKQHSPHHNTRHHAVPRHPHTIRKLHTPHKITQDHAKHMTPFATSFRTPMYCTHCRSQPGRFWSHPLTPCIVLFVCVYRTYLSPPSVSQISSIY